MSDTTYAAPASFGSESLVGRVARRGDVLLVLFVLAIIALMILPLPPSLLDALIAVNIASSVCLLMLSLYVHSPGALSTFPSLLLFTTLLRLALNIASTKQILLHGHAGAVIETFGRLVVGGNVVVGGVVFLIICIVQFIVIAKGAERVAEVGARFTLDALPGKQMSIDADLRSGMIDKEEGRQRRLDLEKESQWHGAMDGAMKFVKGDAIAGLVIAFINILAGIAIGAGLNDMSIADAAARYTLLTVGDGMVSQIPSLFVSVSAGILITRVSGPSITATNLGSELGLQILAQPMAIAMTAFVMATFLLLPGIPKGLFMALALGLGGVAVLVANTRKRQMDADFQRVKAMRADGASDSPTFVDQDVHKLALPVVLAISPTLRHQLSAGLFGRALEKSKSEYYRYLGLPFPGVRLRYDTDLPENAYRVLLHDWIAFQGSLVPNAYRVPTTKETSKPALNIPVVVSPAVGRLPPAEWIPSTQLDVNAPPPGALGAEEYLAEVVTSLVGEHAELFVGIQEVQWLVQQSAQHFPQLTEELLKVVPLPKIADVLRRLIQERIPVRNTRDIFESLITWTPKEKDVVLLTEYVRVELGRLIVSRCAAGRAELPIIVLSQDTEALLRDSVQSTLGGSFLALGPERTEALIQSIAGRLSQARAEGLSPALVCSMDIRRYVKKTLPASMAALDVLSYQELASHIELRVVSEIGLA